MRRPVKIKFLVALLIVLLTAFIQASFFTNGNHTLHNNGNWESRKIGIDYFVMGSITFMTTRVALRDNELDLSAWFGYQELYYKEPLDFESLRLDLMLEERSQCTLLFARDGERNKYGLYLHRNDPSENSLVKVGPSGEFIRRERISGLELKKQNDVHILRRSPGLKISINGSDLTPPSVASNPDLSLILGFKSGLYKVAVDNIHLGERGGAEIHEAFTPPFRYRLFFLFIFLNWIPGYLIYVRTRRVNFMLMMTMTLFLVSLELFCFDFYFSKNRYPSDKYIHYFDYITGDVSPEETYERIERLKSAPPRREDHRILVVGGSQTWGAGAAKRSEITSKILEKRLHAEFGDDKVSVINAAIPNFRLASILEKYSDSWIQLEPKLLVVVVSVNDAGNKGFKQSLVDLLELNRSKGIETLLVLEPYTPEMEQAYSLKRRPCDPEDLANNHNIMRQLSAEKGVPFLDLHSALKRDFDTGFLWWDFVHLTSFGQRLAGNHLADFLLETILDGEKAASDPGQGEASSPLSLPQP